MISWLVHIAFFNLPNAQAASLVRRFTSATTEGTFNKTKSMEKIDITQSLSVFDFRDDDDRYLFDDLQNLTHLVLSDNNFVYIPTGAFYQLSSLESLDLRRCLTQFIYKEAFVGLTSLRTLSLQHNHLQGPPPPDVFPKLTNLFLHDNSLGYLEEDQFTNSSFPIIFSNVLIKPHLQRSTLRVFQSTFLETHLIVTVD